MSSGEHEQRAGVGRLLAGRYRVAAPLGRGGMGVVWRAVDERLGREVAVKELRAYTDADVPELDRLRLRMQREARAAARVRHPGVVAVHDIAEVDGRPLIVMELVDGPSLDDVLRERGTLDPGEVAGMGAKVLDALAAAHRAGVLHRDVKPGNILLDRSGRVLLTDFGIATMEDPGDGSATHLTRSGELVGSLDYLAPERAQGADPGPASDIWALGATLYAAVEGSSPFRRTSTYSTLTAIVTEPLPEPHRAGPLTPILHRLLDKRPENRPEAEEARALLETVASTPPSDTPTTTLRGAPAPQDRQATKPDVPTPPPPGAGARQGSGASGAPGAAGPAGAGESGAGGSGGPGAQGPGVPAAPGAGVRGFGAAGSAGPGVQGAGVPGTPGAGVRGFGAGGSAAPGASGAAGGPESGARGPGASVPAGAGMAGAAGSAGPGTPGAPGPTGAQTPGASGPTGAGTPGASEPTGPGTPVADGLTEPVTPGAAGSAGPGTPGTDGPAVPGAQEPGAAGTGVSRASEASGASEAPGGGAVEAVAVTASSVPAPTGPMAASGAPRRKARDFLPGVAVAVIMAAGVITVALLNAANGRETDARSGTSPTPGASTSSASSSARPDATHSDDPEPTEQGDDKTPDAAWDPRHTRKATPTDSPSTSSPAPSSSCTSIGAGKYNCRLSRTAKSYTASGTEVGVLNAGTNYFYCQRNLGRRETYGAWTNVWWAKTDDDSGNTDVYVSDVYIKGGYNDSPVPGLPVC
ncbi:protein kinase [Streptomyces sp. NPDC048751]|uniref:serine/threonine-protein kinase n=1 Tax=Streptomyces sp. NPDC048751 TaxID=3365591 RepID=UPI00371D42B7